MRSNAGRFKISNYMTKVIKKSLLAIFLLIFPEKKKNILVDAPDALPNMQTLRFDAVGRLFSCDRKH